MKKTTLSHMAMYQNVLAVVKDHQSTWSGVPGVATVIDRFETGINDLRSKLHTQNTIMHGIGLEKAVFMDKLIASMTVLKKGLFLHGVQTNNLPLRERNKEPKSKLAALREDRLQVICTSLLDDVNEHENELVAIAVDPAIIQEFRDLAAAFEERKNSVRQAIIERTLEIQNIREIEKQLNKLLKEQLDRFISLFQSANKTLFDSYKAARKIIGNGNPGGSRNNKLSA